MSSAVAELTPEQHDVTTRQITEALGRLGDHATTLMALEKARTEIAELRQQLIQPDLDEIDENRNLAKSAREQWMRMVVDEVRAMQATGDD